MLVSIIIPCYNCEKFVVETLNSILKQNYTEYEIIAINDCSKDNTLEVLQDYAKKEPKLKVLNNEQNLGVALTRNKGVDSAMGEYIAFLDADDVWLEEKLSTQMQIMQSNRNITLCCTSYSLYDEGLENIINVYNVYNNISYNSMLRENSVGLSTVVMKKDVFQKFKMTNKYIHEDYELWLKLLRDQYEFYAVERSLVKYRIFQNSRNASKVKSLKGRIKILYYEEKINPFRILYYTVIYAVKGVLKYKSI